MSKLLISLLICNIIQFYFYSIYSIIEKLSKFKINQINKILLGYSIFILFSYYCYFFFKLDPSIIKSIIIFMIILFVYNLKNYFRSFFLTFDNLLFNLVIVILLIPTFIYGEQFFIFRGNYWDSSNYLSSAILMKNYSYDKILLQNYHHVFYTFQNMNLIVSGRPIVNYLISLFLNLEFSIFYTYYLFKCFISAITFFSIYSFLKCFSFIKKNMINLFLSFIFIFSFWNIYIFEIDALSHYASIPILLLGSQIIFKDIEKEGIKKKYFLLTILASSLFIIYPEIIFLLVIMYLIKFLDEIKLLTKKEMYLIFTSIIIFIILTIPSISTNYEYLFFKQLKQATSSNDWWGYFGSFILGKENLVLDPNFVNQFQNNISSISKIDLIKFLHNEHFLKEFYFIYLNILPSIFGLYFLLPGKIETNLGIIANFFFLTALNIYLLNIIKNNFRIIFKKKEVSYKFLYFTFFISLLVFYFLITSNFWSIIKLYTYIFPFLFIFTVIKFEKNKINLIYVILVSFLCIYKFSEFNNGIGRHDSFPSILNSKLKKDIEWKLPANYNVKNCSKIKYIQDDYIIEAYLNLMLIDKQKPQNNKISECKMGLKNRSFYIYDE